jgi:ubiquinol-cytochrome c reductase cytochrome b/c1 subunit
MQTPPEIVPEWYFLPYYAILRSVPDKLLGVVLMFGSILVLFALPWLDTSPVRSAKFRPIYKILFWLFLLVSVVLGVVGAHKPEGIWVIIGRVCTAYYFAHFLIILPILGKLERPLKLPESISKSVLGFLLVGILASGALTTAAHAAEDTPHPPSQNWSFAGIFGTPDLAAAQRGLQVYTEVCAACHGLKQLAYRDLAGLGLTAEQVAAIAAAAIVPLGLNDDGEPVEGPGLPSSRFRQPWPNEKAARARYNGAVPPDLSVMIKARENGDNYVHALLTGYTDPPAGIEMGDGMSYNKYFPGHQTAMPSPLSDDRVTYADGTKATVDQMSRDLVTFLAWASDPDVVDRKRMGIRVILFLILMTGLTYAVKRKIWSDLH